MDYILLLLCMNELYIIPFYVWIDLFICYICVYLMISF